MNTLIVYAHPDPGSFNAAILGTATASLESRGHPFKVKDLYAESFQSVLTRNDLENRMIPDSPGTAKDVREEQSLITWARRLIFIYPIWWFDCPAILKGWVERVFTRGFSHTITDEGPRGLLELEKVLILQTTGSSKEALRQEGQFDHITRPMLNRVFTLVRVQNIVCETLWGVPLVSAAERKGMLETVKQRVDEF